MISFLDGLIIDSSDCSK